MQGEDASSKKASHRMFNNISQIMEIKNANRGSLHKHQLGEYQEDDRQAVKHADLVQDNQQNIEQINKISTQISGSTYNNAGLRFIAKKLANLQYFWQFKLRKPWYVPYKKVRQYYGDKIALYFYFVGFMAKYIWQMGVLGLINYLIDILYGKHSQTNLVLTIVFGIVQTAWHIQLHYKWKQHEISYAIQFGQLQPKKVADSGTAAVEDVDRPRYAFAGWLPITRAPPRPARRPAGCSASLHVNDANFVLVLAFVISFKGQYRRSIINNNLNTVYYSSSKRSIKFVISAAVCFFILLAYYGLLLALFRLALLFDERVKQLQSVSSVVNFDVTIPAFLNFLLILLLSNFYKYISEKLTNNENHQHHQNYENSYIVKRYLFDFLSFTLPIVSRPPLLTCSRYRQQPSSAQSAIRALAFRFASRSGGWACTGAVSSIN